MPACVILLAFSVSPSSDVPARSYANVKTVSVIYRLKPSLSTNCLNSSVSSFITPVITRSRVWSFSIRAFSLSEFSLAFLTAVSPCRPRAPGACASRQRPALRLLPYTEARTHPPKPKPWT